MAEPLEDHLVKGSVFFSNFEFFEFKIFLLGCPIKNFDLEKNEKKIFSIFKIIFRLAERHWVVSLDLQIYQIKFTENLSKKDSNSLLW